MSDETVVETVVEETPIVEQAVTTENAEPNNEVVEAPTEKTFTQAQLDEIITKRLERDREATSKKAAQEARDAYIVEQGYTYNGKPITTEAEYKQAVKDQEAYNKLKAQELPDEVIQEMIDNRNFREQYAQTQQTQAQKDKQEADFKAFFETYPDADPKTIPQTVWDEVAKGKSLVDSFARHENQTLKQKLAEFEQAKQVEQQNQANAESSTGSVTGNGSTTPEFYTAEQMNKMSESEIEKNFDRVMASQKKLYK